MSDIKTFEVLAVIKMEVEAFDADDAKEAAHDAFGEGEFCGLNVTDYRLKDINELK